MLVAGTHESLWTRFQLPFRWSVKYSFSFFFLPDGAVDCRMNIRSRDLGQSETLKPHFTLQSRYGFCILQSAETGTAVCVNGVT